MSTLSVARRLPAITSITAIVVLCGSSAAHAAQGPVGLGTAGSFAVLAGSGITNTGATVITGDVGTFPTPSETGMSNVTLHGTNHGGDAVTQGAKNDLVNAYNDAAGRNPATSVPVELGGTTLTPGVYTSPTFGLTGTLTLNAQGNPGAEFIFQAGSTLITASDSRVLTVNGATACNVVWQVGSSATFGTGTQFVGDVLSHTSISAKRSATFQGRLLARDGAVTLIHNTITRPDCAAAQPTPTPTPTATSTSKPTPTPTGARSLAPSTRPTGASGQPSATPTISPTRPHKHHHRSSAGPGGSSPSGPAGGQTPTPSLPNTGMDTSALLEAASGLLGLGALVLIASTRIRRTSGRHL